MIISLKHEFMHFVEKNWKAWSIFSVSFENFTSSNHYSHKLKKCHKPIVSLKHRLTDKNWPVPRSKIKYSGTFELQNSSRDMDPVEHKNDAHRVGQFFWGSPYFCTPCWWCDVCYQHKKQIIVFLWSFKDKDYKLWRISCVFIAIYAGINQSKL